MNLLSFGEVIWDLYEAGERTLGGAPLNFAAYTVLLGNPAWLASAVGSDELGTAALRQIQALGIRTDYLSTIAKKATGTCQIRLLLVTCGEDGALCFDRQTGKLHHCPAEPAVAVSTAGAGDSFGATFLTQYERTGEVDSALRAAARVSAFVVAHKEAIPPTTANFLQALANR